MKITKEHYDHMKEEIAKILPKHIKEHAEKVRISGKFKDFDCRIRWDLANAVNLTDFFCREVYPYANDDHIDTALKAIVKDLNIVY